MHASEGWNGSTPRTIHVKPQGKMLLTTPLASPSLRRTNSSVIPLEIEETVEIVPFPEDGQLAEDEPRHEGEEDDGLVGCPFLLLGCQMKASQKKIQLHIRDDRSLSRAEFLFLLVAVTLRFVFRYPPLSVLLSFLSVASSCGSLSIGMADKSAFVPVDAVGGHKATDMDVDMDAELFGAAKKDPAPAAPVASAPAPPPPAPAAPAPAPPAAPAQQPKFQYKKAATFTKTYAGKKKEYHMVLLSCHLLKLKEEVQMSYSNGMDVFRRLHPDLVKAKTVLHKFNVPIVFRIPEVQAKIDKALYSARKDFIIFSEIFETHRYGYKLALIIAPAGEHRGLLLFFSYNLFSIRSQFLSFFACVVRGDYDPVLQWPFRCPVTFTIRSSDGKAKASRTFVPNGDLGLFDRPKNERNIAFGFQKFCEISELKNFVKNDDLFVEMFVDTNYIQEIRTEIISDVE